jgi:hypothetical protein
VKEIFDLVGLVLPFRFKVLILGLGSLLVGGWIVALYSLIPELIWTGIVLVLGGLILLGLSLRTILTPANKEQSDPNHE